MESFDVEQRPVLNGETNHESADDVRDLRLGQREVERHRYRRAAQGVFGEEFHDARDVVRVRVISV